MTCWKNNLRSADVLTLHKSRKQNSFWRTDHGSLLGRYVKRVTSQKPLLLFSTLELLHCCTPSPQPSQPVEQHSARHGLRRSRRTARCSNLKGWPSTLWDPGAWPRTCNSQRQTSTNHHGLALMADVAPHPSTSDLPHVQQKTAWETLGWSGIEQGLHENTEHLIQNESLCSILTFLRNHAAQGKAKEQA